MEKVPVSCHLVASTEKRGGGVSANNRKTEHIIGNSPGSTHRLPFTAANAHHTKINKIFTIYFDI